MIRWFWIIVGLFVGLTVRWLVRRPAHAPAADRTRPLAAPSTTSGGRSIKESVDSAPPDRVLDLRGILDEASPRYCMHSPATWPRQTGLLAEGEWFAFSALTDQLRGAN